MYFSGVFFIWNYDWKLKQKYMKWMNILRNWKFKKAKNPVERKQRDIDETVFQRLLFVWRYSIEANRNLSQLNQKTIWALYSNIHTHTPEQKGTERNDTKRDGTGRDGMRREMYFVEIRKYMFCSLRSS